MKALVAWLQQPTSVAGISAVVGTVSGLLLGQITCLQAAPLLAGALVSIALPDNAAAKTDAEAFATSLAAKLHSGNSA